MGQSQSSSSGDASEVFGVREFARLCPEEWLTSRDAVRAYKKFAVSWGFPLTRAHVVAFKAFVSENLRASPRGGPKKLPREVLRLHLVESASSFQVPLSESISGSSSGLGGSIVDVDMLRGRVDPPPPAFAHDEHHATGMFGRLGVDVCAKIFQSLGPVAVARLASVSRDLYAVSSKDQTWKRLYFETFGPATRLDPSTSWKQVFLLTVEIVRVEEQQERLYGTQLQEWLAKVDVLFCSSCC